VPSLFYFRQPEFPHKKEQSPHSRLIRAQNEQAMPSESSDNIEADLLPPAWSKRFLHFRPRAGLLRSANFKSFAGWNKLDGVLGTSGRGWRESTSGRLLVGCKGGLPQERFAGCVSSGDQG